MTSGGVTHTAAQQELNQEAARTRPYEIETVNAADFNTTRFSAVDVVYPKALRGVAIYS